MLRLLVLATNCLLTNPLPLGEEKKKQEKEFVLKTANTEHIPPEKLILTWKYRGVCFATSRGFVRLRIQNESGWTCLSSSTLAVSGSCLVKRNFPWEILFYSISRHRADVTLRSQKSYECKERTKCQPSTATIHLVYVDTISQAWKQLINRKVELASNHGLSTHLKGGEL